MWKALAPMLRKAIVVMLLRPQARMMVIRARVMETRAKMMVMVLQSMNLSLK